MGALAWVGVVLVVLWLLGWLAFKVASGLMHLLLVIGIVLLVWGLVKRGASAVRNP